MAFEICKSAESMVFSKASRAVEFEIVNAVFATSTRNAVMCFSGSDLFVDVASAVLVIFLSTSSFIPSAMKSNCC